MCDCVSHRQHRHLVPSSWFGKFCKPIKSFISFVLVKRLSVKTKKIMPSVFLFIQFCNIFECPKYFFNSYNSIIDINMLHAVIFNH